MGIPATKLIEAKRGENNKKQGSWIHPNLIYRILVK